MAKKKVVSKKPKAKKAKELTRLGTALRTLGGLGGSAVGSLIGMPGSGGALGSSIGASLSKWLGSGDYEVSSNSILQRAEANGTIPAMHKEANRSLYDTRSMWLKFRGRLHLQLLINFQ